MHYNYKVLICTAAEEDGEQQENVDESFCLSYPEEPCTENEEQSGSDMINTPDTEQAGEEYGNIPGAEPTPPPEPSPEYPKIRIKTTGLLKEGVTITEITDE